MNHSAGHQTGITATATVFDLHGKKIAQKKARLNTADDTTQAWLRLSKIQPTAPSDVWFLRLQLSDRSGIVSENLYIMGREENNFQAITTLPQPMLQQHVTQDGTTATVTVRNTGKTPAVFLRLNLKGADGEQILPVIYSDNYFTLMPGEIKTIAVKWRHEDTRDQTPVFEITSIN